ncbi:MAG: SH3 domain-containing protein, partial [Lachnospiraceae bacterium]
MKKRIIPALVAIVLIIVVIGGALGIKLAERYAYSKTRADLTEYYQLTEDQEAAIILQNDILEEKAKLIEGRYYLDFATVQTYCNDRFYWDQQENLLLYTTPTDIIGTAIDTRSYSVSGQNQEVDYVIATYVDNVLYIAIDYVKQYTNLSYETYTEPNRIQIYTQWSAQNVSEISKDTAVRYQGGVKSDILEDLSKGTQVTVLEEMETWSKVKTNDGVIGYVENKRLQNNRQEEQTPVTEVAPPDYTNITRDHKINLAWHQVTNLTANANLTRDLAQTKGINTISPTWFSLSDNEGNFTSLASPEYVTEAHNRGMEVWGLIDNFSKEVDTKAVLSYTSKRTYLIQNIMNMLLTYNLDGINIDFESIAPDTGEHYIEFIRELS